MSRYPHAGRPPADTPASEALLFAQALLGYSGRPASGEAVLGVDGEHLERLAGISPEWEHKLRAAARPAAHDAHQRQQLEWLAEVSTEHRRRLRELLRREAAEAAAREAAARILEGLDRVAEEDWDPAKHPRLGGPPNAGWFAATGGSLTAVTPRAPPAKPDALARPPRQHDALAQAKPPGNGAVRPSGGSAQNAPRETGAQPAAAPVEPPSMQAAQPQSWWGKTKDWLSNAWNNDPAGGRLVDIGGGKMVWSDPAAGQGPLQAGLANALHHGAFPAARGVKGAAVGLAKTPDAIVNHVLHPITSFKNDRDQLIAFGKAWEKMSQQERMDFAIEFASGAYVGGKLGKLTGEAINRAVSPYLTKAAGDLPRTEPVPPTLGAMSRAERLARKLKLSVDSPTTRQVLNSLDDTVGQFVARFRQGRILRELPREVLNMTVEEALQHSTKVRKLLTDGRFAK